MKQYYINQLKKLTNLKTVNIKLSDFEGNQTNNMDLNLESIQVLAEYLKKFEDTLRRDSKSGRDS